MNEQYEYQDVKVTLSEAEKITAWLARATAKSLEEGNDADDKIDATVEHNRKFGGITDKMMELIKTY